MYRSRLLAPPWALLAALALPLACSQGEPQLLGERTSSPDGTAGTTGQAGATHQPKDPGLDDDALAALILAPPVSLGPRQACAALATGQLRCWGTGWRGQLGQGLAPTVGDDETPASVGPLALGGAVHAISLGSSHACARLASGAVRCWGDPDEGKLGLPGRRALGDDEAPGAGGDLPLDGAALQVAAGERHTCALLAGGRVRCWGRGWEGQLGDGGQASGPLLASSPDVATGGEVAELAVGEMFTCARYVDGRLRCWGHNGEGMLGDASTKSSDKIPAELGDVQVGGPVKGLSASGRRVCALLASGDVRCWGQGGPGALGRSGDETLGDDEVPASVPPLDLGEPATQVSLGQQHGCALLASGAVRCWGDNLLDLYVYGTSAQDWADDEPLSSVPTIPLAAPATQLASGNGFSCALLQTGQVSCWGRSLVRGTGQPIDPVATQSGPWQVALGAPAVQIAASVDRACAVLTTGEAICWGAGIVLGYGDRGPRGLVIGDDETPATAAPVPLGAPVGLVAAGDEQTCASIDAATLRCWGDSLLDGVPGQSFFALTLVGDDEPPTAYHTLTVGGPLRQIVAGGDFRCALTQAGEVRCWYPGASASLIASSLESDPSQLPALPLGATARQLAAGERHACALLVNGAVRCWGDGWRGKLGYPGLEQISSTAELQAAGDVALGGPARQVVTGSEHTCALLESGAVRCWGHNAADVLGHDEEMDVGDDETPASAGEVPLGEPARMLAAGSVHTCALLAGGRVRCWGYGKSGQLGLGPVAPSKGPPPAAPLDVLLGEPALFLAAGGGVTCAVLAGGRLRCWGYGGHGQLGRGSTDDVGDDETPASAGDLDLGGALRMP